MVRNFGGMLLLLVIFAVKDRGVFRIKREHLKYFFGTGVVSVMLFTMCYFSCQQICSLAVASVLLYTSPSFVVLLSAVLWKEPVTEKEAAGPGTDSGGLCLCVRHVQRRPERHPCRAFCWPGRRVLLRAVQLFGRTPWHITAP